MASHRVYNPCVSTADAATAFHDSSLMPPHLQEEPGSFGLGTVTYNADSQVIELPKISDDDIGVVVETPTEPPPDVASSETTEPTATTPLPAATPQAAMTLSETAPPARLSVPLTDKTIPTLSAELNDPVVSERRRSERDLAGDNAVLLAKTQATAAWVQSETMWRQMKQMEQSLVDERDEAERVASELTALRRELEAERHERTAAQAASDELRRYLDQQQSHLGFLRDRIVSMESERDIQQSCLGWLGRRRFRRLLQQRWEADPHSALLSDNGQSAIGNPLSVSDDPA